MKYCAYCLGSQLSSFKQKKTKMVKLPSFHFRNWWLNKAVKFYLCSILYKSYLILQNILNFIPYFSLFFFGSMKSSNDSPPPSALVTYNLLSLFLFPLITTYTVALEFSPAPKTLFFKFSLTLCCLLFLPLHKLIGSMHSVYWVLLNWQHLSSYLFS